MERAEAEAIYDAGRDAVVDVLLALSAQVAEATSLAARAIARIEDLEAQVARLKGRSSRNSSLPPSQDPPGTPPRPSRGKGSRKRGGQSGHQGSYRKRYPPEQVDETVDVFPEACSCGCMLAQEPAGVPRPHQVVDIPPVTAHVSEYRLHTVVCPACRKRVKAKLPTGVSESAFGASVHGFCAMLASRLRASREQIQIMLKDMLDIRVSVGAVDEILRRQGEALAEPYQQALDHVRGSPSVNVDETGWRDGGWVWGAFTPDVAVYRIDPERSAAAAVRLLGSDHPGVVTSDRHGAYNSYQRRQVCWPHIQRNIAGLALKSKGAAVAAPVLDGVCNDVFAHWRAYQADGDRSALIERIDPLSQRVDVLLAAGTASTDKFVARFCRGLDRDAAHLWTFATVDGVEPSNNHAERQLRPAVIHRKVCGATHTDPGHRAFERILTATQTCRLQGKSALHYLTDAIDAHWHGRPAPSLLPN